MIKKLIPLLLLLALTSCASLKDVDWDPMPDETYTTTDKILLGSYVVANVIDASQTIYALEGCDGECKDMYIEGNPVLGENPSRAKVILLKSAVGYGIGGFWFSF